MISSGRACGFAAAVLVLLAGDVAAQDSRRGDGCASCHADAQAKHLRSAHAAGAATCVDCHGGDASARTEAAAHGAGFRGKIARTAIPRLCAECHSDVRRMSPFALPTDQFKSFAVSRHGEAVLGRGSLHAAVCTDCHGVHDPVAADDPKSPVHPKNQPATCDRCHADATLMASVKLSASTGKDYAAGVHGRGVAAGLANAPSCSDCHGSHGASAPGAAAAADVCGRCHTNEKTDFLASPHGGPGKDGKIVRCVDCHAPHATHEAGAGSGADVATNCATCHAAGTPESAAGIKLKALAESAGAKVAAAEADLRRAALDLSTAERARRLLDEVAPGAAKLRAAAHSLDLDGATTFAARLEVIASEAAELARRQDDVRKGRLILAAPLAMVAAGLVAGLLMLRAVVAARRRRAAPEQAS